MKQNRHSLIALALTSIFLVGCVPNQSVKPTISTTPIISSSESSAYGYPPQKYKQSIRNYFSNKLKSGKILSYRFSKPQRAFKRKGLAYGGEIDWRGWLVDVAIVSQSRTGRILSPKPYMVLFKESVIIKDIMGKQHALLTRVDK